jgi:hypothetical protein
MNQPAGLRPSSLARSWLLVTVEYRTLVHAECTYLAAGGSMTRSMVGLLAAVGSAMSVLATLAHGNTVVVIVAVGVGAASGSAAYLALAAAKPRSHQELTIKKNP